MSTPVHPYTYRAPTLADLAAVVQIRREASSADFGVSTLTAEEVRAEWDSGTLVLDTDAWLVCAPEGTPVAYGEVEIEQPVWGSFWVRPAHRGTGIEPQLLQRIEAQAAVQVGATTLFGRASDHNEAAQAAYEQAGYTRYLSFQIMQIDLDQPPPAPQWPEGITVRPFFPDQDDQATYAADEESALDKGYHDPLTFAGWAERMGRYKDSFDPSLWFLAWDGADLAGVALNYISAATTTGWVDHLGVRRPWRKRGVGKALLLHAFGAFYARGIRTVKLSVDSASLTNAPRLYAQVGMEVVQFYHIYRKELASTPV
jgi:GNAT superfamily N-acetyltransferase